MDDAIEVRAAFAAHALNALAILGTFAAAVFTHGQQPDVVPLHFDAAGFPDRWGEKSWGNTLAAPLIGLAVTAIVYAAAQLAEQARRHPSMLNFPDREKFLALPPALQEPIWRQLKAMTYWLAVPQTLVFLTLALVAPVDGRRLHVWPVFVPMALALALAPVLGVRLMRRVREAVAAGGPGRES